MSVWIFVLAFVAAGLLVWKLWKPIVRPPKKEVAPNEARIIFFYTNWCGHSKKAMPEWEKFEEELKKSDVFGTTKVIPVRVDSEEDVATATLYDVVAYPTVLLETSEGIVPYDKRVTASGLSTFLRHKLGQERSGL
jgi:thiol-disulfide isomerase/thioredoxin